MAGFVKRMFGRVWGGNGNETKVQKEYEYQGGYRGSVVDEEVMEEGPRIGGGFRVQKAVRKPEAVGPILRQVEKGQGGVQGLRWYSERLKMDEDDDVAEEFLREVVPMRGGAARTRRAPALELVLGRGLRTVRPYGPMSVSGGNVHQSVEAVGRPYS